MRLNTSIQVHMYHCYKSIKKKLQGFRNKLEEHKLKEYKIEFIFFFKSFFFYSYAPVYKQYHYFLWRTLLFVSCIMDAMLNYKDFDMVFNVEFSPFL